MLLAGQRTKHSRALRMSATKVKITVVRDGEEKEFEITRAKIENPSVTWEIDDNNIGYMRISTFGDDTAELAKEGS